MIAYSPRAARALGFLKRNYNDIEIYIEDTTNTRMWITFLRLITPVRLRLTSINSLGGRASVIAACRRDQTIDGRKRLYIIDGDFDYMLSRSKPNLRFLHRLNGYCVENLLIRSSALAEVAADSMCGEHEVEQFKQIMASFIIEINEKLRKLFVVYATTISIKPSIQTVAYPVTNFLDTNLGQPSLSLLKINRHLRKLVRECCKEHNIRVFRQKRKEIQNRVDSLPIQKIISGKDYLLPLIHIKLAKEFKLHMTKGQLAVQLAKYYSGSADHYLRRKLVGFAMTT